MLVERDERQEGPVCREEGRGVDRETQGGQGEGLGLEESAAGHTEVVRVPRRKRFMIYIQLF